MLANIKQLDTGTKLFFGALAAVMSVAAVLSVWTHQSTTELTAGPANCTIDSAHVKSNSDGSVVVLRGAIVDCDRFIADPANARFTVKSELSPLGEVVKRSLGQD